MISTYFFLLALETCDFGFGKEDTFCSGILYQFHFYNMYDLPVLPFWQDFALKAWLEIMTQNDIAASHECRLYNHRMNIGICMEKKPANLIQNQEIITTFIEAEHDFKL